MIAPYIGQTICFLETVDQKDVSRPVLYIGMTSKPDNKLSKPTILVFEEGKILKWYLNNQFKDCDFIKEPSDATPTKKQIRYGKFCKFIKADILLKAPDEAELIEELTEAKKFIL